jgi:GLPGLI family protein
MKRYLIIVLFICHVTPTNSQTIEAHYKVILTVDLSVPPKKNVFNFDYEGFLYNSGAKTIYFQKPLCLQNYPTGEIRKNDNNNYMIFPLCTDSLQRLELNDIDSLTWWYKLDGTGNFEKKYYKCHFDLGVRQWIFLDEVKEINGLQCQHAKLYNNYKPDEIISDVWFYPHININFGPAGIRDLPGSVVEATNYYMHETYSLTSYSVNATVPNTVFWPKEFNIAMFTISNPLRKKITGSISPSIDKRADIIKQ